MLNERLLRRLDHLLKEHQGQVEVWSMDILSLAEHLGKGDSANLAGMLLLATGKGMLAACSASVGQQEPQLARGYAVIEPAQSILEQYMLHLLKLQLLEKGDAAIKSHLETFQVVDA